MIGLDEWPLREWKILKKKDDNLYYEEGLHLRWILLIIKNLAKKLISKNKEKSLKYEDESL